MRKKRIKKFCKACSRNIQLYGNLCGRCYNIKRTFRVNPKDIAELRAAQKFLCAICKQYCVTDRSLGIDHDHITGKVRGLLCLKCNLGVHYLDNPDKLRAAAQYLEGPYPSVEYVSFVARAKITEEEQRITEEVLFNETPKALRAKARLLAEQLDISVECAMSRLRRIIAQSEEVDPIMEEPSLPSSAESNSLPLPHSSLE